MTGRRSARRSAPLWALGLAALLCSPDSRGESADGAAPPAVEMPGAAGLAPLAADAETPRLFGAGSGRFAVIAASGSGGLRLAELAERAWGEWREPLGLPSRLPASITVRLLPAERWQFGAAAWQVASEPGGVVTVWIRDEAESGVARDRRWLRALAEGALRRKAYLLGVAPERAKAPAWLAAAAAEAVLTAERPALLDAWQASMREAARPARLRDLLLAENAADADALRGAFGVWLWLREEGGRSGAWARFGAALVAGESPGAALAREFAVLTPRPAEAREWELAWRVAAARLARARTTPVMEPDETRRRLEALARIVVLDTRTGGERVAPAEGDWALRGEAWPAEQRRERARILAGEFSRMHPFYRNAAGSLGRAWTALARGKEAEWRRASEEWAADMAAGRTLEAASKSLLDAAEAR